MLLLILNHTPRPLSHASLDIIPVIQEHLRKEPAGTITLQHTPVLLNLLEGTSAAAAGAEGSDASTEEG